MDLWKTALLMVIAWVMLGLIVAHIVGGAIKHADKDDDQ